jgi:hypothetical protein
VALFSGDELFVDAPLALQIRDSIPTCWLLIKSFSWRKGLAARNLLKDATLWVAGRSAAKWRVNMRQTLAFGNYGVFRSSVCRNLVSAFRV